MLLNEKSRFHFHFPRATFSCVWAPRMFFFGICWWLLIYICIYVFMYVLSIYLFTCGCFIDFLKGSFPHRRRKSPKPALVPLRGADRATSRRSHRVAGARVALALFVWLVMMMSGLLAVIRRKPLITRAIKCYEQKLSRSASHFERARGLWGLEKSQSRLSVSRSR